LVERGQAATAHGAGACRACTWPPCPRATQCWPSASCELQKPQAASVHASGGGRIPEPPKVAAVTTEAQQRRHPVLILYCTLTLTHYALLLGTVMSDEDKSWISGKLSKHTFTCIFIMFSLFDQIEKSYTEKWCRTRLSDWLYCVARAISIGCNYVDVDLYF
jgi:hypothetical protein